MDYTKLTKDELIEVLKARENEQQALLVQLRQVTEERDELNKKIQLLLEGQRIERARKFAPKSEITKNIINEAEENCTLDVEKTVKEKKKPGRKPGIKISENFLSDNIKKTVVDVYPDEKESISDLIHIGYDTKIKVEMQPIEINVIEYHFHKYAKQNKVYQKNIDDPFGGYLTPCFLASILYNKYVLGVPLYRLEKAINDRGLAITRQALSNYIILAAQELYPLYERLRYYLLNNKVKVLHADETTLKVLEYKQIEDRDKSYMWVYATTTYDHPIYIYDFEKSRSRENPREFLKDYKGHLVVDGYEGYSKIDDVTLAGCWAHVKRKFTDIIKGLSKEQRSSSISVKFIKIIDKLFKLEDDYKKLKTVSDIEKARKSLSKPIVDEYFQRAEEFVNQSDGKLREALEYSLNQRDKLIKFLDDGCIPLSNNLAERAVKPFVICRKNFLFSKTHNGATATAIVFSIIQTAKMNCIDPFMYLSHLFSNIWKTKQKDIDMLLPWSDQMSIYRSLKDEKCRN